MLFEKIADNCIYAYDPELELIFGVLSLLKGGDSDKEITDIFGEKKISEWKSKYQFLFETYAAVRDLDLNNIFDFLLDIFNEDFNLQNCYEYFVSQSEDTRIYRMAGWAHIKIEQKEILNALNDDDAMDLLYSKTKEYCNSYLGLSSFVRQNKRFIKEYFELAKEMNTPALKKVLKEHKEELEIFKQDIANKLETEKPLDVSQKIMGKTFHNQGPYEMFYFVPALLLPEKRFRLFYENGTKNNKQILFCSLKNEVKNSEEITAALKVISDETRYQILRLLSNKGPIKGQDIVKELKLAPSTISHHMSELKESGLITEEPVKTSKYYGIASNRIKEVLETIKEDFNL